MVPSPKVVFLFSKCFLTATEADGTGAESVFTLSNLNHPYALRKSIPYSQLLRIRRNCSRDSDFDEAAKELLERFRRRGYPEQILNEALLKASRANRPDLLERKVRKETDRLTFVTTYDRMTEKPVKKAAQRLVDNLIKSQHNDKLNLHYGTRARVAFKVDKALGSSIGKPFKQGTEPNTINQTCVYRAFLHPEADEADAVVTAIKEG